MHSGIFLYCSLSHLSSIQRCASNIYYYFHIVGRIQFLKYYLKKFPIFLFSKTLDQMVWKVCMYTHHVVEYKRTILNRQNRRNNDSRLYNISNNNNNIIIILIDCRQMAPCPLQNGITRRARRNNNIIYNNNNNNKSYFYSTEATARRGTTNGGGGGSPAVTCDS